MNVFMNSIRAFLVNVGWIGLIGSMQRAVLYKMSPMQEEAVIFSATLCAVMLLTGARMRPRRERIKIKLSK
jgi:hypothetical protein